MSENKPIYPSRAAVELIRCVVRFLSRIFFDLRFSGLENIPKPSSRGFIVAPNHPTFFDPFWVSLPIKQKLRFMAWDKAFDWIIAGRFLRFMGAFPVNLERGSKASLRESMRSLSDGAALVVFPEGSREFSDGKLLQFKTGLARIAIETGAPILPVTIRGANRVWPRDFLIPRPGKVEIVFHPLLRVETPASRQEYRRAAEAATRRLREIIESAL